MWFSDYSANFTFWLPQEYSDDAGDLQDTTVVFLNNNTRKAQIY